MKTIVRNLLLASVAATSAAVFATIASAQEVKVDVMHNMASESQQGSVRVLMEALKQRGFGWNDNAIAGGARARAAMVNRAVAGDPAEIMYVPAKLMFKELTDKGLTATVAPPGWQDWKSKVPASIWDEMMSEKGEVVITPIVIGIHNVAFFNSQIMQRAGAEVPKTWDELFPVLEKIKALGDVVPLAFTETPIQLFQTLHNVTAGVAGQDVYNRIYTRFDPTAFDTSEFRKAAETLKKLKPYTDRGRTSRVWQDAADMVATGKAGSMVYGTFALEPFIAAKKVAGVDYQCSNLGGTAILGPNGFMYGRPDNERERGAINAFAAMVMDPKVQTDYALEAGGLPTRIDADVSKLNRCILDSSAGLKSPDKNVKDPAMTMAAAMSGAVQDAVVEFWASSSDNVDPFIRKLKAAMTVR